MAKKIEVTDTMRRAFIAHIETINEFLVRKKVIKKKDAKNLEKKVKKLVFSNENGLEIAMKIIFDSGMDQLVTKSMYSIAHTSSKNIEENMDYHNVEVVEQGILDSRKLLKMYEEVNNFKFDSSLYDKFMKEQEKKNKK